MKILMATMSLDIGGAETHIVELAKELVKEGHEVLIASNGGVYVPEAEAAGVRHFTVPMHRRSLPLMLRSYRAMRKLIKAEKPDIVHAHARIPAFICGILKKTMKFPFVTTAHWVFDTGGALRLLTNWGDKTIAVSDDISDYLTDNYKVPKKDIFVTINGIDTEKFSPDVSGDRIRQEFKIAPDAPVVAHVSRLDESRALAARFLIDISVTLAERVPSVVILIAGGGDMQEELNRRASEANLRIGYRCVIMAGPRTDINEICAAGDVFVGVSRAALEAMAAGKPVLVAGNEGCMGIFDEDKLQIGVESNFCCRGLPMIERRSFLDGVTDILTMPLDERERLGEYGRGVVMEHYSVERMARDAMSAYKAAIPGKRIVMSGYYGYDNAGDEAILTSIYTSIMAAAPDAEVTVLSIRPAKTRAAYGCRAVARFSPFALYREIKRCDVMISGSGSLLQDRTSTRSLLYYLSVIRLAEHFGKKVMLYANGIGPVNHEQNRRRVKKAVELADVITLRDEDSLRELREMGVTREDIAVAADPVFLLDEPDKKRTDEILAERGIPDAPYITVSVRPWDEMPEFYDRFAAICDGLCEKYGMNIVFVPMQPLRDEPVSWDILEHMRYKAYIISGDYNAGELMGVIGGSELVLSMRLHALIFAARMATPAVGFVYDPKVKAYLKLLNQPSAGSAEDIDAEAAMAAASIILEHRPEIVRRLEITRDEVIGLSKRNEEALGKLLKEE